MKIWRKEHLLFTQLTTVTIIACSYYGIKNKVGNIPKVVFIFSACIKSAMVEVVEHDVIRNAVWYHFIAKS